MASKPDNGIERDIDQLYQLTLDEFTAARNALAKNAGAGAAAIKALEKPNIAAWAVNQLYWRKRAVFDALVAAAQALRAAHGKRLAGKGGDVAAADEAHRAALKRAADEVRAILQASGDALSAATMNAVTETLQALPGPGTPGRLSRPLKPLGLEALVGLVPAGGIWSTAVAAPVPSRSDPSDKPSAARAAAEAKRADAARKKEIAETTAALREARDIARQAVTALERARQELARAERERDRLQDQLQFATKQAQDTSAQIKPLERTADQKTREVERLELSLLDLQSRQLS